MNNGVNAVVIYDDLTTHAVAYRQMALLLRRPPGREAYPGDIFFVHARLLERASQLTTGGSLTSLPIVQTFGGDLTGYISTNIISITDGQIFLVDTLFNSGIKPAIDLNLSVSRVGSAAQFKAMDFVSRRVKQIATMYRMYSTMSKVGGGDFDFAVHVRRGERLIEFMKQDVYVAYSLYKQVLGLYAISMREMDVILTKYVRSFFNFLSIKDTISMFPSKLCDSDFSVMYKHRFYLEAIIIINGIEFIQPLFDRFMPVACAYFAATLQIYAVHEVDIVVWAIRKRSEIAPLNNDVTLFNIV